MNAENGLFDKSCANYPSHPCYIYCENHFNLKNLYVKAYHYFDDHFNRTDVRKIDVIETELTMRYIFEKRFSIMLDDGHNQWNVHLRNLKMIYEPHETRMERNIINKCWYKIHHGKRDTQSKYPNHLDLQIMDNHSNKNSEDSIIKRIIDFEEINRKNINKFYFVHKLSNVFELNEISPHLDIDIDGKYEFEMW